MLTGFVLRVELSTIVARRVSVELRWLRPASLISGRCRGVALVVRRMKPALCSQM